MMWENTFLLKSVFDLFEDCFYLPGTLAAAYYKVVCEAAHLAGIQQDYIGCLFVAGNFDGFMG